jgi:peptidoglycan/xylan/chitin deacetylase (PgdA/CDA1 family)
VSDSTRTLILNIAPLVLDSPQKLSRRPLKRRAPPTHFALKLMVTILRRFGFRFVTASEALQIPSSAGERLAVLTMETSPVAPASRTALRRLERLGLPTTLFVATGGLTEDGRDPRFQWKELRRLQERGWELGVLGHEAVDLSTRSYLEQRQIVAKAKTAMQSMVGKAAKVFSYPFGAYDATTLSCVREEGFLGALSGHIGPNDASADRFQLRQIPLGRGLIRDLSRVVRAAAASPSPEAPPVGMKHGSDRPVEVRTGAVL